LEIILTGRGAPDEILQIADLVTDMQEVKHYFHKGVSSRTGIDH
jgi:cob(I)alamin adenosyltransferase